MKQLNYFLCFCLLLTAACKKEPDTSPGDPKVPYFDFHLNNKGSQEFGYAAASVFGLPWEASPSVWKADSTGHFSVSFRTYSDLGERREEISFGLTNGAVGQYSATNNNFDTVYDDFSVNAVYGSFGADGDFVSGIYQVDSSYANIITIQKNDGDILEGTFSLLFTTPSGIHSSIPGKVFFKDGKFRVKLK